MLISIEGPGIAGVRDGNDAQHELYSLLIQDAVAEWMKKNHTKPNYIMSDVRYIILYNIEQCNILYLVFKITIT